VKVKAMSMMIQVPRRRRRSSLLPTTVSKKLWKSAVYIHWTCTLKGSWIILAWKSAMMDATITSSLTTIAMAKPARLRNSKPPLSRSQRRNVVATSQKANVKVFLQSAKEATALTIQRSIDGASVNLQRLPSRPLLLNQRQP